MTLSSQLFLWVFYFIFCYLYITEAVSLPSEFVVYSSDLSFYGVLVSLKLLLCGVSSDSSATKSWPLINRENLLIVKVLSKRALNVLDINMARYIPIIGPQAYVFSFERDQILLVDLFVLKGFVSCNT